MRARSIVVLVLLLSASCSPSEFGGLPRAASDGDDDEGRGGEGESEGGEGEGEGSEGEGEGSEGEGEGEGEGGEGEGGEGEGGEGEGGEGEGEGEGGEGEGEGGEGEGEGGEGEGGEGEIAPPPPGAPALLFSDLDGGPSSGWHGADDHGAAVTIWGRGFGRDRGDSTVTVCGVELVDDGDYLQWGGVGPGADLERVTFLVPSSAARGAGEITVTVGGLGSAPIDFTVRDGTLAYVRTDGDDDGDGTWNAPWRTVNHAIGRMQDGDVTYLADGVRETREFDVGAAVNLGSSGREGAPKALVALPGARVIVGALGLERGAFHNWDLGDGGYTTHWTVAGLEIVGSVTCMPANTGFRIVGNRFSAPEGDGATGCIEGLGDHLRVLGNEFTNVGDPGGSKLYHVLYLTGERRMDGPRAPTESDREVGWNWFHDNDANRAIDIYSEQDSAAFIEGHRIHDNRIEDQRGDGILIGYHVTGDNWVVGNLIVRAGLGPDWPDDASSHAGIRVNAGHPDARGTVVHVYNNTLVDCGWSGGGLDGESGNFFVDDGALDRTEVDLRNNVLVAGDEPQVAAETPDLPAAAYTNLWSGGDAPDWDLAALRDDPLFVGANGGDYRLGAGSPAVDAGVWVDAVWTDLDGVARPQGIGFDLGAYERVP